MHTVLDLFTALPGLAAGYPILTGFTIFLFGGGLVLFVVALTRATAPMRPTPRHRDNRAALAAEDRAREARIRRDDAERAVAWPVVAKAPTRARPAVGRIVVPWAAGVPVDTRTAELVVDPTLKPAEVAEMMQHVVPGEGSVVSISAEAVDTRLRTPRQLLNLAAAERAAHAEAEEREERRIFAEFDGRLAIALTQFRTAPAVRRADTWAHYEHGTHAECPVCSAEAEISGEYRVLRGAEDTRSWTPAELQHILAGV